jgi:CRP-like cAMP-binding protein
MNVKFRNEADINQHLYLKSEKSMCVYFLVEGSVKIYREHPTKNSSVTLQIIHPNTFFGYCELFTIDKKRLSSACVISKHAIIDEYSANDFLDYLIQNSDFFIKLIKNTIKIESGIWHRCITFREYNSVRKIGWMLIRMADPIKSEDKLVIKNFTHSAIGEFTGSSRQSITTALNYYRKQGVINYDRKQLIIYKSLMEMYII